MLIAPAHRLSPDPTPPLTVVVPSSSTGLSVALAQVLADTAVPLPLRQMAAVLLRQYAAAHWCRHVEDFVEPEPSPQVRPYLASLMANGSMPWIFIYCGSFKPWACIAPCVASCF